jgi:hypothetical protein
MHLSAGSYGYEYGNFVKHFYYFLTQSNTVHQALDNAINWVFGVQKFDQYPLTTIVIYYDSVHNQYVTGWMKIYGNSHIALP